VNLRNKVVNEPGDGDTDQADPVAPQDEAVRGLHILHGALLIERRLSHT
jgi:hypothetical protein